MTCPIDCDTSAYLSAELSLGSTPPAHRVSLSPVTSRLTLHTLGPTYFNSRPYFCVLFHDASHRETIGAGLFIYWLYRVSDSWGPVMRDINDTKMAYDRGFDSVAYRDNACQCIVQSLFFGLVRFLFTLQFSQHMSTMCSKIVKSLDRG